MVTVRVSVMVRVSIRTSWVVNFALFRCYRPVIYTRPDLDIWHNWSMTLFRSGSMVKVIGRSSRSQENVPFLIEKQN